MNKILSILIALFVVLAACAPPVTDPQPPPPDAAETVEPGPVDDTPDPKGEVVRGLAPVEEVDILMLESFPVQINVFVRGYVPDACTEISDIVHERAADTFKVSISTVRPKDMACAEVIMPYEESISLDVIGLEAGVYTVDVNGVTETFELQVDNALPRDDESDGATTGADPDEEGSMIIGIAPVEQVRLEVVSRDPLQVNVIVTGYLPDGCTELDEVLQERAGDTLYVKLTTKRPAGVACITVIVPFEEVVPLDVEGLSAGTYSVQVNELSTTLTVE